MTKSVDDSMIAIYCFVDEFLKTHPVLAQWRRSPHAQPPFSDAEALTLARSLHPSKRRELWCRHRLVARIACP